MAHGMGSWRASSITVPSGADVGLIYRFLAAPPDRDLRVVQLSGYGSGGAARFTCFLIPPAQGTAAIYSVVAGQPIYAVTAQFATNGATQTNPTCVIGVSSDFTTNPSLIIPAGWSLGAQPSVSTSGPTELQSVGVLI